MARRDLKSSKAQVKTREAGLEAVAAHILATTKDVLVVSDAVLTDEACAALTADWDAGSFMDRGYEYQPHRGMLPDQLARFAKGASLMRAALSRLAKGETT